VGNRWPTNWDIYIVCVQPFVPHRDAIPWHILDYLNGKFSSWNLDDSLKLVSHVNFTNWMCHIDILVNWNIHVLYLQPFAPHRDAIPWHWLYKYIHKYNMHSPVRRIYAWRTAPWRHPMTQTETFIWYIQFVGFRWLTNWCSHLVRLTGRHSQIGGKESFKDNFPMNIVNLKANFSYEIVHLQPIADEEA